MRTVITNPICPYCGLQMISDWENDDYYCQNDCAFEAAQKKLWAEEDAKSEAEKADEQRGIIETMPEWAKIPYEVKTTICWHCFSKDGLKITIERKPENYTGVYLHACQRCGHNLEKEPIYGRGGPRDLAILRRSQY